MTDTTPLVRDMNRYIGGDDGAGQGICLHLEPEIRRTLRGLLSPDDPDTDDLVQEVLVAKLRYLRQAGMVPDNPVAFAATMARNRFLNLQLWKKRRQARDVDDMRDTLPHLAASPLDLIDDQERLDLLKDTLARLDRACRDLLRAFFRQEVPVEALRRELGLKTVQAVYYRKDVCLKKAQSLLNRRLFGCREAGETGGGKSGIQRQRGKEISDV